MKIVMYIFPFILCLFLVSCTVKPPELVVKGVQTEKALLFLTERQNKTANKEQFNNYMQHLRLNYAPGFQWDEYWSGISERKLYKNLSQKELDHLLSLSQISCERKDWIAFSNLLLQIGKDEGKLLFSRELNHSQTLCSVWLPNPVFKSIVQFLSEKRSELEKEKIAKEKLAYINKNGSEVASGRTVAKQRFIYTEELQRVLIDEWLRRHTGRNWGEVLDVVDRRVWSDVRYINYLNGDREHLPVILEMEKQLYKSIEAGLDLDILLMFEEPGKMADIIKLAGYKKHFSVPGALDWSDLWRRMLIRYPKKPENGNVNSLLDFYNLSCGEKILNEYGKLVRQWEESIYERSALSFCDESNRKAVLAVRGQDAFDKLSEKVFRHVMEEAHKSALDKVNKSKYRLLDESLGTPAKTTQVYDIPLKTGTKGSRTIEEVIALLFAFKAEQFDRTRKDWRTLLEKHFSDPDWLFALRVFRDQGNSFLLSELLDMHNFVYSDNNGNPGKISFLYADIEFILDSEVISLTGISDKYGYKKTYIYTDEIVSLFWRKLKSSLTENRENLKRVVSIYEEEKQLRTSKQWRELFKKHFVDQNWLNLLGLLREKVRRKIAETVEEKEDSLVKVKTLLSKVLGMLYEIYEGEKPFFEIVEADVQSIIKLEGISLSEIAEKYNYDKTYMKGMMEEANDLFWRKLKDSLERNPGNLVKAFSVYEREKHLRTPKKWRELYGKYFDEQDWLNLMRFLQNDEDDISKTRLSKVLDMHYEIGEGKISFLEAAIWFILESEEISLVGIANKYKYKYDYIATDKIIDMFWQKLKKSVEENPENLLKVLSVYEEESLLRSHEKWQELFEKYFDEQDWLNLVKLFTEKIRKKIKQGVEPEEDSLSKTKVLLSKILSMYHEVYDGRIPFFEKYIRWIIESEGISLAEISEKYGIDRIYIEDIEEGTDDLYWRKLRDSLEKNPGNLLKVFSLYRDEKRSPEEWKKIFEKYLVEQHWVNLIHFLYNEGDAPSLSGILDMHYALYKKVPFLQSYIQDVLRSDQVSLANINVQQGFRDIYVESPDVYYQFWNKVKSAIDERMAINWETIFKEKTNQCSFSHVRELFLFFSQLDREYLLINQFKFKNCSHFIEEFKGKEWDRLVSLVRHGKHRSGENVNSPLIWWLARVLFLFTEEDNSFIREAVSKISGSEWKDIIRGMLETYVSKSPEVDHYLFMETLNKVRLVYDDEVESTLCSFLAGEKSLFFIQEYDSGLVMDFLYSLSWSKRSGIHAGRKRQKFCSELIPMKKRNTLLYGLARAFLKRINLEERTELVSEVWSVAVKIMDLSVKMNNFEDSDIWNLSFRALFNMRTEMSDYDFYLQFSDDILELLLSVSSGDKNLVLNHLTNHVWNEAPASSYHGIYRDWIAELLRDKSGDYPWPSGSKKYIPLPKIKLFSRSTDSVLDPHPVNTQQTGPSDSQRGVQSVSSDDDSQTEYGQIFMEETSSSENFDYEISLSSGMEGGNPYISSHSFGLEIKKQVHSLVSLGLDYSFYDSRATSIIKALEKVYGLDFSYPLLKHTMYFNGHYNIFKSHLNLAGLFRIKLDIPLQIGLGFMNMGENNTHFSMRWGVGPRVQVHPRLGVQFLFSQSVSAKDVRFLYTWYSLVLSFGF